MFHHFLRVSRIARQRVDVRIIPTWSHSSCINESNDRGCQDAHCKPHSQKYNGIKSPKLRRRSFLTARYFAFSKSADLRMKPNTNEITAPGGSNHRKTQRSDNFRVREYFVNCENA